jgi:hypothetical protein
MYKIMFSVGHTNDYFGYIKINGFSSSSSESSNAPIKNASLSYDSTGNIYMNVNSNSDTSTNDWFMIPTVIPLGYSMSTTPMLRYNNIERLRFVAAPSTDTTIVVATVTDGF